MGAFVSILDLLLGFPLEKILVELILVVGVMCVVTDGISQARKPGKKSSLERPGGTDVSLDETDATLDKMNLVERSIEHRDAKVEQIAASDRSDKKEITCQSNNVSRCHHKDLETASVAFSVTDNEAMTPQERDSESLSETDDLTLRLEQDLINHNTTKCCQPSSANNNNDFTQYDISRAPSGKTPTGSKEITFDFMAAIGINDNTHTDWKNSNESWSNTLEDRTKSKSSNDGLCGRYDVEEDPTFDNKLNLYSSICESEENRRPLGDDSEDVYQHKASRGGVRPQTEGRSHQRMIVDNGDAAQVELLMQDRDSIRLWKEMILEDNARLSSETIRLRRENDAVIRENERLKKVRRHLGKVRETSRGKDRDYLIDLLNILQSRDCSTADHDNREDSLQTVGYVGLREQPLGSCNLEQELLQAVVTTIPRDHGSSEQPRDHGNSEQPRDHGNSEQPRDHGNSEQPTDSVQSVRNCSAQSSQQEIEQQTPLLFQLVFVGDSGVGKTSFIRRACEEKFSPRFNSTVARRPGQQFASSFLNYLSSHPIRESCTFGDIYMLTGVDFQSKTLDVGGKQVVLQMWDTAGQERFRSMTQQYFRKADGAVVMYDVTSENSFKNVRSWMHDVQEGSAETTVVAIIGNKRDLIANDAISRQVTPTDGEELAKVKEFNAFFYESSAKTGEDVEKSLLHVVGLLIEREQLDRRLSRHSIVRLDKSRQQSTKTNCCGRNVKPSNS